MPSGFAEEDVPGDPLIFRHGDEGVDSRGIDHLKLLPLGHHRPMGDFHGRPQIVRNGDILTCQVVEDDGFTNVRIPDENDFLPGGIGRPDFFGCTALPSSPLFLAGSLSGSTIWALAIEFHPMVRDLKTVAMSDLALHGFHVVVLKFNDLSTLETDQVIMVGSPRSGFISGFPIDKFPLNGKAGPGEELQCPINGRIPDLGIDLYDLGIDL